MQRRRNVVTLLRCYVVTLLRCFVTALNNGLKLDISLPPLPFSLFIQPFSIQFFLLRNYAAIIIFLFFPLQIQLFLTSLVLGGFCFCCYCIGNFLFPFPFLFSISISSTLSIVYFFSFIKHLLSLSHFTTTLSVSLSLRQLFSYYHHYFFIIQRS